MYFEDNIKKLYLKIEITYINAEIKLYTYINHM